MRRRGFTLVEIMIVILIIGVLLAIAVPQFLRAKEQSLSKVCIANLRDLEYAKELYAMDNKLANGAPCTLPDLWPAYLKGIAFPNCPAGGTYTVGPIGTTPTCSLSGGSFPHDLGY
jgi:prepilin-type N-terminal cleavage/methylation domain-containing protein